MQQVKQQPQTPQQQQVKQQPQTPQQVTPQPQRLKPILKSSAVNNQANQGQAQSPNQAFNQNPQNQQGQQSQPNQQHQQNLGQLQQSNNGMDSSDATETMDSEVLEVPKWRRKTPGCKLFVCI